MTIVKEIVKATQKSGAVRHSAECFNYFFAQELDVDFLLIWDGFKRMGDGKPWAYKDEDGLRQFLHERIAEGYCMPLNPVWVVRDMGWWQILQAQRENAETAEQLAAWYPHSSGLME